MSKRREWLWHWSDRLHRFFDFLAIGGGSALVRKDGPEETEHE